MTAVRLTQEHISLALTKLCTENHSEKNADILAENINTCPKLEQDSSHLP